MFSSLWFRCTSLFVIQLFCSLSVFAQTENRLYFDHDSIYVGRLKYTDQPITKSFAFQAFGDSMITIEEVESDCACVTVNYPKKPIAPQETGEIRIAYFPYKPGPFEKIFNVKTNGDTKGQQLILTGYIEIFLPNPTLEFPHKIGNFRFKNRHIALGSITNEGVVRRTIELYNDAKHTIELKDSVVAPAHIEVIVNDEKQKIKADSRSSFDLYYHPEMKNDYGYLVDNIVLFTNDSLSHRLDLTVTSIITQYFPPLEKMNLDTMPKLSVPVSEVDLGRITLSRYAVELVDFTLKNEGKVPLKIHRVNAQEGCKVLSRNYGIIAPAESVQLKVQVQDIGKSGTQARTVLLYTNDPQNPVVPLKMKMRVTRN